MLPCWWLGPPAPTKKQGAAGMRSRRPGVLYSAVVRSRGGRLHGSFSTGAAAAASGSVLASQPQLGGDAAPAGLHHQQRDDDLHLRRQVVLAVVVAHHVGIHHEV